MFLATDALLRLCLVCWPAVALPAGVALSIGALLVLEQISMRLHRRDANGKLIPGPAFILPFLGGLVAVIKDPTGFWEQQRLYAPLGLSANYIMGKFMIFSTNNDVNRAVLSNNGPEGFDMALHPNAEWILGQCRVTCRGGCLPRHCAARGLRSHTNRFYT